MTNKHLYTFKTYLDQMLWSTDTLTCNEAIAFGIILIWLFDKSITLIGIDFKHSSTGNSVKQLWLKFTVRRQDNSFKLTIAPGVIKLVKKLLFPFNDSNFVSRYSSAGKHSASKENIAHLVMIDSCVHVARDLSKTAHI